jgi:hypothetical protein
VLLAEHTKQTLAAASSKQQQPAAALDEKAEVAGVTAYQRVRFPRFLDKYEANEQFSKFQYMLQLH